jgi:mannosyltransferase
MTPRSMSETVSGVRSAVLPVRRIGRARLEWLLVAGTVAALLALAVHQIKTKPFWYDEAMSLTYARMPLDRFVATMVGSEGNGSLYYAVLRAWRLLGEGEARIRFLSVLCMAATIPLLYLIGRRHVGRQAALIACTLFAVSPFVIEYAQEARMYAMVTFLTCAAVLAWSLATETDRARWWIAFALLASASLYAHVFAGFVVLGLGLTWLLGMTPRTRNGFAALAVVGVAAIPIGAYVVLSDHSQVSWVRPFSERDVAAVLGRVGGGSVALAGLLYVAALVAIPSRDVSRARRISPLVAWWLTPTVLGLAISLGQSLLVPRYFIVALPPLLLLAGLGSVRTATWLSVRLRHPRGAPALSVALLTLVVVLTAPPLGSWYALRRDDFRGAADWVARTAEPGDRIIYNQPKGRYPFGIYLDQYAHGWPVAATVDDVRTSTGRTWVVLYGLTDFQGRVFRATLPGYVVAESKVFSGLRVQLLERRAGS